MKTQLINNELYHICYRAVGDSVIFLDEDDYFRGIFSLYEFNNSNSVEIWKRRRDRIVEKKKETSGEVGLPPKLSKFDERNKMVEILIFCFMPNHIHLMVKQLSDNGISKFIQKVGTGYGNYFNKKYNRKGHLFNRFKSILIESDDQLRNVFAYIHCNPISLIESGWKDRHIKNINKVIKFLESYRWSSYMDYIGLKNFPSVISKDFFRDIIGGSENCKEAILDWVKYKNEINLGTGKIFLE